MSADLSADVVVLSRPVRTPRSRRFLTKGMHVVSTTGSLDDVRSSSTSTTPPGATGVARGRRRRRPGLSGLLARYTQPPPRRVRRDPRRESTEPPAGVRPRAPSVAAGWALGWHDGQWLERPAGSGRELCWFPEPVGARDCYRGELADPVLLHRSFPDVERISARQSATRRDRLTARLPMLSPPHPEGGIGALRVEARGCDETGVPRHPRHRHRRTGRYRDRGHGGRRRQPAEHAGSTTGAS